MRLPQAKVEVVCGPTLKRFRVMLTCLHFVQRGKGKNEMQSVLVGKGNLWTINRPERMW